MQVLHRLLQYAGLPVSQSALPVCSLIFVAPLPLTCVECLHGYMQQARCKDLLYLSQPNALSHRERVADTISLACALPCWAV